MQDNTKADAAAECAAKVEVTLLCISVTADPLLPIADLRALKQGAAQDEHIDCVIINRL